MNTYEISVWQGPKRLDHFTQVMLPEHVERRRELLMKRYGTTHVVITQANTLATATLAVGPL